MTRARADITQRSWLIGLVAITLLAMGLRMWGLDRAGETWDEVAYYDAANAYYQNVQAGDWRAASFEANREHPAIAKWLYLIPSIDAFQRGVSDLHPGRLLSALLGALTVLVTMLLARRLYSRKIGLLAGIILALLPPNIALSRVLGLDTSTTFFFTLTVWCFLEAIFQGDTTTELSTEGHGKGPSILNTQYSIPTWFWHLLALIAFGLAIGTRFSNALLWPLLAMIAVISRVTSHHPSPSSSGAAGESRVKVEPVSNLVPRISLGNIWRFLTLPIKPTVPFLILLYFTIPFLILYGTWPWLWQDVAAHWSETIGHWNPVSSFFLGVIQYPDPTYYLLYYLVSFPGLLVIVSLFAIAATLVRGSRADWIILAWFLAVFGFALYGLRQGGIRYLLQLTPALAIMVAAYLVVLTDRMKRPEAAWLLPSLFVAYLIPHALVHQPYQLDYYNEFTGGTRRVAEGKWFQVGWWGEGIEQAVLWLNANAPKKATLSFTAWPDRTQRLLRSDFEHTPVNPDYILTNPSYAWYHPGYPDPRRYHRVYVVEVRGASIAEVWKRR